MWKFFWFSYTYKFLATTVGSYIREFLKGNARALSFFLAVFVPLGRKRARVVFRSHLTAYRNNPAFSPMKDVGVSYIFCGGDLKKNVLAQFW